MQRSGGRELTAQELNKQIIAQVLKEKEADAPVIDEQKILDQLPQCPLHPVKISNQRCRK